MDISLSTWVSNLELPPVCSWDNTDDVLNVSINSDIWLKKIKGRILLRIQICWKSAVWVSAEVSSIAECYCSYSRFWDTSVFSLPVLFWCQQPRFYSTTSLKCFTFVHFSGHLALTFQSDHFWCCPHKKRKKHLLLVFSLCKTPFYLSKNELNSRLLFYGNDECFGELLAFLGIRKLSMNFSVMRGPCVKNRWTSQLSKKLLFCAHGHHFWPGFLTRSSIQKTQHQWPLG